MRYQQLFLPSIYSFWYGSALAIDQIPLSGAGTKLSSNDIHCRDLAARFPKLVNFPHDVLYEKEQSQYWSGRQSALRPACRLTPSTTQDVSDLLQNLHGQRIDFAIANGGHSTVPAASNIDAGITLDLSFLSSIKVAANGASVRIGTGARWLDVYQCLDPKGVTVAGARAGAVGTGGFLLGGGISILAPRYGWSCDTLESIEMVSANGAVMNVDRGHYGDLFRSLKGGGSNFGIATSFTMRSFHFNALQVAFIRFGLDQISELIHEISVFTRRAHHDLDAALEVSLALDSSSNKIHAFLMMTRFGLISQSPILQPFFKIPHSYISVNDITPGQLARDVDDSNPSGYRAHRCTMTIANDADTVLAIAQIFTSTFQDGDAPKDEAYRPACLVQPISQAQLDGESSSPPTGNILGLEKEEAPLLRTLENDSTFRAPKALSHAYNMVVISFEVRWSLSSTDDSHIQQLNELLERCRGIAAERGTLHPYIYLNYAAEGQDAFQLLRKQGGIDRLKAVRSKYDEHDYLERHLSNPFKIGD